MNMFDVPRMFGPGNQRSGNRYEAGDSYKPSYEGNYGANYDAPSRFSSTANKMQERMKNNSGRVTPIMGLPLGGSPPISIEQQPMNRPLPMRTGSSANTPGEVPITPITGGYQPPVVTGPMTELGQPGARSPMMGGFGGGMGAGNIGNMGMGGFTNPSGPYADILASIRNKGLRF